jgi:hypothetical protein
VVLAAAALVGLAAMALLERQIQAVAGVPELILRIEVVVTAAPAL